MKAGSVTIGLIYALAAFGCLLALYATASSAIARSLLPYTAGPFALVSVALAVSALRRGHVGWPERVGAVLWGVGAVAGSASISTPPLPAAYLWTVMRASAFSVSIGSIGVLVLLVGRLRGRKNVWQWGHGATLVALALFLGRAWEVALFGPYAGSGGLARISFELGLSQGVLLVCGAALVLTSLPAVLPGEGGEGVVQQGDAAAEARKENTQ